MAGFEQINSNSIKLNYKNKDYSYGINSNKAIKITKDDIKFFEKNNNNEKKNSLNFCYYAENNSSLSMKLYFLENYKKYQALNILYPGVGVQDIIPKNSIKKYKIEFFNIREDMIFYMYEKTGKCKLYLYISKPDEDDSILEKKILNF